jgi:hypothetical protein
MPNGGAGNLPRNYSLAAVLSETRHRNPPAAAAANAKSNCKTHTDEKIVGYCTDCKVLICVVCSLYSHSGHKRVETDDADKEFKQVINEAAKNRQRTAATHREKISELERRIRFENLLLKAEESRLMDFKSLSTTGASFIEREAAARELQESGYVA